MLQQLLIPLDGSGFGEETLPYAAALARKSGADVAVAHVHVPHVPDHLLANTQYQYQGVDLGEYEDRDRAAEESYLRSVADRLTSQLGRPVRPVLLDGTVEEAIDDFARGHGPGLILMTTHGRTGLSRAWLGSVADALVRHAPWPVLLVRPEGAGASEVRFRKVMVPLDGSERAERILGPAAELARDTGARFLLVRVVSPNSVLGTRVLPLSMASLAEARRHASAYVAEVAGRLRTRGFDVETRVVEHPQPALGLLEVANQEGPDLVAMATHGYRGVTRAVLGSVADKVLRGCGVPLLLLGPGVDG